MQVCKGHTVTLRRTPSAQGAGVARGRLPREVSGLGFHNDKSRHSRQSWMGGENTKPRTPRVQKQRS